MNAHESDTEGPSTADALDAWLADDTVVAVQDDGSQATDAETAEPESDESADATASPWSSLDPLSSWLLRVALALIIVVLATSAAMVVYFMTAEKAPRTAVERDTAAAEIAVRQRPSDAAAWQKLAYAYAKAGRFDEALKTIRTGRTTTHVQALLLPEADILRAAGRQSESLSVYNDAIELLSREESAAVAARIAKGVTMAEPSQSLVAAYYGRGLARGATGDQTGAIKDILAALELAPGQVELNVSLGDLYAATNQDDLARAAYKEALRYVPDYEGALQGLARLEKGQ